MLAACSGKDEEAKGTAGDGGTQVVVPAADARASGDTGHAPAQARRQEQVVFRLGPNLLLAHVQRNGGLFVDAGSAGFVKYQRFAIPVTRWALGKERDGVRVAVPDRVAAIEVPLTEAQVAAQTLFLGVHAAGKRRVALKLNGRKAGSVQLVADSGGSWQVVQVALSGQRPMAGENFLAFETGSGKPLGIAWIQLGGEPPANPGPASAETVGRRPVRHDADTDTLSFDSNAGLVYYVHVPETGHLVADVEGAGCRIEVHARAGSGAVDGELAGAAAGVSLEALAGQVARLELTARGCPEARVRQARLTTAGPADEARGGARPKHIVLWLMSGLRADRVRPFAPWARPEVPGFERLAQAGTVFDPYWVQASDPRVSRGSLWASHYPVPAPDSLRERVRERAAPAAALGKDMRAAGFHTIGITAGTFAEAGLTEGFAVWQAAPGGSQDKPAQGADVLATALALFGQHQAERPVFLLVHTADTRLPWEAHEPWLGRYDPGSYQGPYERTVRAEDVGGEPGERCDKAPAPRDLARIRAIYDATVSYQDALVVQLLDQLAQWGVLDQTMVILTSDLGMGLWEDGRCGPEALLREPMLHVPLLIHYPPLFPGGRVVRQGAEAVDLGPTLLRSLGLPVPAPAQGQPLVTLAQDAGPGYPRPLFAFRDAQTHAMRLGSWTIHVSKAGVPALYDVKADPLEKQDLAGTRPIERRFLTDVLSLFLAHRHAWNKRAWGVASNMTLEALRQIEGRAP